MKTVSAGDIRRGGGSSALAVILALLTLVPIVVGMLITSPSVKAGPGAANAFRPVASTASASAAATPDSAGSGIVARGVSATSTGSTAASLPAGPGALVAVIDQATVMRSSPGGRALRRLATHTEFHSPEVLWVVEPRGRWLGVISPLAGNGRLGWIPRSSASLQRVNWEIRVSLSARRVTVLHAGTVLKRYTVAVGQPAAPTPTGHFAVTDLLAPSDPTGPYGCCIIALSALAPHAIQDWSGGNRIAIHSTTETASIGQPVSHGCLRLTLAEGRWLMSHIPLGTPTLISA